jgi:hypothetical protein
VTRDATKARQRVEGNTKPAAPAQKRQKTSKYISRVSKRKSEKDHSSESEERPADARVLDEVKRLIKEDELERGFLSWRKQDAEGILLLASAIKYLCARTVCRVLRCNT